MDDEIRGILAAHVHAPVAAQGLTGSADCERIQQTNASLVLIATEV